MKLKIKGDIVTLGVRVEPTRVVGTYVEPREWNALIQQPDVIVIDTRNEYEFRVGTFRGAINPHIRRFTQFPDFLRLHLEQWRDKKIAMFCTGGIRCEKSTSLAL
uniref:Rhodanese domain-containing protein n=1 Tax=Lygus hesperus TaxID=30085 RepID=A0A0A9ZFW3_LYGHE